MQDGKRRLLWHGMLLFLLGLLTGLAVQRFANPRMGLSAHLEGVMNGILLMAFGALWDQVRLSRRWTTAAFWSALAGTYGNWATTTLAAAFGTIAMTPIAGAGHGAAPWQEGLATAGFVASGLAILAGAVILLAGLRRKAAPG